MEQLLGSEPPFKPIAPSVASFWLARVIQVRKDEQLYKLGLFTSESD